jgi:hypothetical protein
MGVTEATDMFKSFAKRAFSLRWGAGVPLFGRVIQLKYHSQYESQGLEASLKESFGDTLLFGGRRDLQSLARCKVAVTTTDTNREAILLSNYNRMARINTPYHFQRFEKPQQELSIWEAARATSATPGYFRSFYKPENCHTYQDGALKLNNPVLAADYERQIVWPECAHTLPDILLSIGTGHFPDAKVRTGEPGPRVGIGLVNGAKAFVQVGRDFIEEGLDCEKTWEDYVQCTISEASERKNRLHRLTLPIDGPKIDLDAVDKMAELEERTKRYYGRNQNIIDKVAAQLVASLFYFSLVSRVAMTVTGNLRRPFRSGKVANTGFAGMIKCRLPQDIAREGSITKLVRGLRKRNLHGGKFAELLQMP